MMKKKKLPVMILCGVFLAICMLFFTFTFFNNYIKKEESQKESESKETSKTGDMEKEPKMINLSNLTTLEVITDCTKFTPVTQDQSYNFETDMNQNRRSRTGFTDMGDMVYLSLSNGGLFCFYKDTGSADIACDRPDCEHDVKTAGGDCQANLHQLDLDICGLQYYKGDLYYTLGGTMLYKMSLNREIKYKYASLLGEKGFGTSDWLIHRGYIYFYSLNDGIYKMPVDNPSYKELIISMPEGISSDTYMKAYGSYLYFTVYNSKKSSYAAARYNTESNQIEQFVNVGENLNDIIWDDNTFLNSIIGLSNIMVHDGKLYYTEGDGYTWKSIIYQYDIASGKNEVFLKGEDKDTNLGLIYGDSDYIYIWKNIYEGEDYYSGEEDRSISSYFAYTWDGELAGEILNANEMDYNEEPLEIVHCKSQILVGSDSNRIYYLSMEWDQQTEEDGNSFNEIEGSRKVIISYINKAELSAKSPALEHIAGEISVQKGVGWWI
ncbi:MAG: hypothetical protein K2N61_09085 [Lachnospiraceae bacterium]|nr:hypothetical protein [Lachnospiraceae bacterium]